VLDAQCPVSNVTSPKSQIQMSDKFFQLSHF
jgi:hypothetical protein